jgi:hypothetical protein
MDKGTRDRLEGEIGAALKRKSPHEGKLAGALRAVAPLSPALRGAMCDAATSMLRRKSVARDLYAGCVRSLAECGDKRATELLREALLSENAGGSAALSAACFSRDTDLGPVLAKVAASRQSHIAFGAETARVLRGESNGAHLTALAPMIKESHRIALCVELLVPLARSSVQARGLPSSARAASPALAVLRGAERHLGRWLVMAEVAVKAGDAAPLDEARARTLVGPQSARAAWSLVAWALSQHAPAASTGALVAPAPRPLQEGVAGLSRGAEVPATRPTVELVSRLSDRPSADRDTTFLFRMARAGAPSARPMLETLVKGSLLGDEVAIRAALCLAKDYGRDDLRQALLGVATGPRREELRGLATAALWDLGSADQSHDLASELSSSRYVGNVAWAALVRAAWTRARAAETRGEPVVGEIPFRWIQWGWLE